MPLPAPPAAAPDPAVAPRDYWCFLSYRHADNKEPGRQWATWLQVSLETYEVPADLVGRVNDRGDRIPERIYPVFRDETDLPADAELSKPIEQALARSRFLVVLCSPHAVVSRFVREEIVRFKTLQPGNKDRILAAILAGDPAGGEVADITEISDIPYARRQCFPRPLRYGVAPDGTLTDIQTSPIAPDFRLPDGAEGFTSPAAYREHLGALGGTGTDAAVTEFEQRMELMKLKIIAGILAIPLDVLTQRDQEYRRRAAERREAEERVRREEAERLQALAEEANERRRQLLREISRSDVATAAETFDGGKWRRGVAYLGRALGSDPENRAAMAWLWNGMALGKREPIPDSMLAHENWVMSASFSPDGLRIVTASWDKTARVWDAASGRALGEPMRHENWVMSARFSPDGQRIVTASADQTARVWDAASGRALGEAMRHEGHVASASFSPDGQRIVTASWDKTARVWDAATGRTLGEALRHEDEVSSASFSPDGRRIVTASGDNTARVWDAATGRALGEAMRHEAGVRSASFSPDGRRIVTASYDQTARVWDAATGRALGEAMRHEGVVERASFSPDGQRILTASRDKSAQVWDAAADRALGEPMRHEKEVLSASFSPDGLRIVTASDDKTARVWDAASGRPLGEAMRHEAGVSSASFSPDGQRIVTASWDQTARVWDAATGRALGEPMQHEDEDVVYSASFSPDGQRILTASGSVFDENGSARVWDAATGRALGEALRHEHVVHSASFSPDGQRIVTASGYAARIWPVGFPQQSEEWLPDFVAAAGGLRFNADGVLAEVPMPERLALREKLRALRPGEPGSPVRDRDWARLLRWWLTPPAQRPTLF